MARKTSDPCREMMKHVRVYQQPAGFVDAIIMTWIIEDHSSEVVQCIHQRDLFAAALSEDVKRASWLAHEAQAWIGAKMTAAFQLTDTDFAFVAKAACRRAQGEMKKAMRELAIREGKVANFKCGPYEVLKLAFEAHSHCAEVSIKNNLVLAGLRRNGMLSWRPVPEENKFVRSDSQPWAKDLPEGSHRYPSSWLRMRYDWLHEDGPEEPLWDKCGKHAGSLEDMADTCYHGLEGDKVRLGCWKGSALEKGEDEPCIVIDADEENLEAKLCTEMHQRSREAKRNEILDKMLSGGQKPGGKEKANKTMRAKRRLARASMRKALKVWRVEQREMLKQYSRQQLLEALVPAAGAKTARQKGCKKAEGCSKKKARA